MAISFDNALSQYNSSAEVTHTVPFTVGSGSNRIVLVGVRVYSGTLTSAAYGGSALTAIDSQAVGSDNQYLRYLVAPAAGANDIVVTLPSAKRVDVVAIALAGAKQTGQPDSTNKGTASSTDASVSHTTVADGAVGLLFVSDNGAGGTFVSGTNCTVAASVSDRSAIGYSGAKTPPGSLDMHMTLGSSGLWGAIAATVAPASTSAGASGFLALM